jgi:signal transduction histidine kinase
MAFSLDGATHGGAFAAWSRGPREWLQRLRDRWSRLSLSSQFAITASIVILLGMAMLGAWVSDRIAQGVVRNSAANAALYLVGFVEPHVQALTISKELAPEDIRKIDAQFNILVKQRRILGIKVWAQGGRLAYSSDKRRLGQDFPVSDKLRRAWLGSIEPELDDLSDEESADERSAGARTLEVYAPVRNSQTNEIIAVAEVYEIADELMGELRLAYLQLTIVVGSLAFALIGSLFHIVSRGSRTITEQQAALSDRIEDLSRLVKFNRELRLKVADANRRASESNDQFLRRIGAELHDGPAQLIGLGLLRLDALRPHHPTPPDGARDDLEIIRGALSDALKELRSISAGISIPQLENASLSDAIEIAVRNHEYRTSTSVELDVAQDLPPLEKALVTCLYRFVQEGLNNAFRHAGGKGQHVVAVRTDRQIVVSVSDKGDGLKTSNEVRCVGNGLGLSGLRDRILSMGGEFEVISEAGQGTQLLARFNFEPMGQDNA